MEELILIGVGAFAALLIGYRLLVRYALTKVFEQASESQMDYLLHHPDCQVKGRFDR